MHRQNYHAYGNTAHSCCNCSFDVRSVNGRGDILYLSGPSGRAESRFASGKLLR